MAMKRFLSLSIAVIAICASAATFPNDDQAIVHVLNRIGFGPRPGDVEKVRAMGLQRYIDEQLHPERIADAADDRAAGGADQRSTSARARLRSATSCRSSRRAASASRTPKPAILPRPVRAGPMAEDAQPPDPVQQKANSVIVELSEQKLLRAVYSERQLQEVLTDFWFNHFNVDARKGPSRVHADRVRARRRSVRTCSASSAICSARPRRARRCSSISTTG